MIDLGPPFATGDTAYTARAPGGYAALADVPADPAGDTAYTAPSLGGEFVPGSGKAAPTASPVKKGADADGGAQDIADTPRVDVPTPPTPPAPVAMSVQLFGKTIVLSGVTTAARTLTVSYKSDGDGVTIKTLIVALANNTSAGAAAAKTALQANNTPVLSASTTSNAVTFSAKSGHTLDIITGVVLA